MPKSKNENNRRKFNVDGMTCAGCAGSIEAAVRAVTGVRAATVNVGNGTLMVEAVAAGEQLETLIKKAVSGLGYKAESAKSPEHHEHHHRELSNYRLVSSLLFASLFMADMVLPFDWFGPHSQLIVATFVTFVLGYPLYLGAWGSLRHGRGNMDLLVGIGVTAAWGYSVWSMYRGSDELYFESGTLIIAVVYLGKYLEAKARKRTDAGLASLARSMPTVARVVKKGGESEVLLGELKGREILAINPGERVPVDGVVTQGSSALDESLLSGEPLPVAKTEGDKVVAGSINGNNRILVKVERVGSATRLGQILALADEAQFHKIPEQKFADRFSGYFSYLVLGLAALTITYWLTLGGDSQKGMLAAVAVLVAACPCALGLATPAAILSGVDAAAKAGVLICNPESLAKCRKVNTLTLDKTGTLTEGSPKVVAINPSAERDKILKLTGAVQMGSNHPLALAVLEHAEQERIGKFKAAADIRSITGKGMTARLGKKAVVLGSADFLAEKRVKGLKRFINAAEKRAENGESLLFLAADGVCLGFISFYDRPLAHAKTAIKLLAEECKEAVLLSGDNKKAVQRLAEMMGIKRWRAKMTPEGKAKMVNRLKREGRVVAAFGDGINDTAMLTAADVGVAVGKSADITAARADLVLLRQEPMLFDGAMDIGARTYAKIRQNLFWAFLYNAAILPIAAAGLLQPALAASAMAMSSVSVVASSLSLQLWKPRHL